jgi:hypothetical protein
MSVRLSTGNNAAPTGRIFMIFDILSIFRKSVQKILVSLKSDKNNWHFAWRFFNSYCSAFVSIESTIIISSSSIIPTIITSIQRLDRLSDPPNLLPKALWKHSGQYINLTTYLFLPLPNVEGKSSDRQTPAPPYFMAWWSIIGMATTQNV